METYDKYDKYSIEKYGQGMVGKTFQDLIDMDIENEISFLLEDDSYDISHENKRRKGGLGQIVEERFFHYKANSTSAPDFEEAGVELKTSPYKLSKKKNKPIAKERLVLNIIDYFAVAQEEDFETSHLWYKSNLLLLVYYLWTEKAKNRLDYRIDFVRLFTPNKTDLAIIKNDYQKIIQKIKDGLAHELSDSDTMYLAATTKGANGNSKRKQPFSPIPAKQRAFTYKTTYVNCILNNYILGKKPLYESILKDAEISDFEKYVIERLSLYKGKTVKELCEGFSINTETKPKNLGAMLAFRMLGVKSNNAEEFVKAGIVVKTIRVKTTGKIKENMSFPVFKFQELVNQEWEASDFYEILSTTKFLFVIYKEITKDSKEYYFYNAMFWNMSNKDLEEVHNVFDKTKSVLENLPRELRNKNGKYKGIFPKQSENRVSHVRPHGQNSKDTYPLPDGREFPRQCFWLNNSYIESIIESL